MKLKLIIFVAIILPLIAVSQKDEKQKFGVTIGGFVRNDITYNTRQVVSARSESHVVLAPAPILLDREGNDINAVSNFNIIGLTTRLKLKITGPDAFGAKTSGAIETDFLGSPDKFELRLRHAFVKLQWKSSSILIGQYWHPMWATECYPKAVSFGAGVPFNPLSRVPQIRYIKKLGSVSILASIMSQGMFKSKGNPLAHQNSSIPELHFQLQYKNELISAGAGVNYQVLMPRTLTDSNFVTSQTISSLSYFAYFKTSLKPITVKLYGMYGQSNDNLIMMGGYAIADKSYSPTQISKNFVDYTPYNTISTWLDIETNNSKFNLGLFAGYSKNLGSDDKVIVSSYTGRWGNVNSMMRIAPRAVLKSNKFVLSFEIEYSAMDYAEQEYDSNNNKIGDPNGIDSNGKVTHYVTANNIKPMVSVSYHF